MPLVTLCVTLLGTQSVPGCIPTRSVGTIKGLMIGIELKQPIRDLPLIAARDHGLLINVTRGKTIRLLPPLTIDDREVEMIVRGVRRAVNAV
ncbi:Acetylornithine/succinyldiaminopimelate aminotransferase [Pseudomonas fluorescens]|uniref:Acetylornithine/succinyldiaminopimelate aminotransferase n=1 Tax=Pseudomonas fluorescens TaxID=294 RepID=A0A5E7Q2Z2_PSEFL|nr:Acetylornithine/succinyldiaminopimelate aminotransferase [Pseudomonas fluorescens]